MSTLSPPTQLPATRQQYTCPVCNMGCGHEKGAYVKRSDNTEDVEIGSSCNASSKKPVEHDGLFQWDHLHEVAFSIRSVEGSNRLLQQDGM